jgi:hypothetical protein
MAARSNPPDAVVGDLARCLAAVAARLEPKEAARVSAQGADTLTRIMALAKTNNLNAFARPSMALGLSALAAHLESKEGARVSAEAAATLMQAMALVRTEYPHLLPPLGQGLAAVTAHLEPKEGARVSAEAVATLSKAMDEAMTRTNTEAQLGQLAQSLAALAVRLDAREGPRVSAKAAATLTLAMTKDFREWAAGGGGTFGVNDRTPLLQGLATLLGAGQRRAPEGPLAMVRLSDQDLVDLLKGPLCVGRARRAILDQLQTRHQRTFADQWDFVRFAEDHQLGLDFTRAPQQKIANSTKNR